MARLKDYDWNMSGTDDQEPKKGEGRPLVSYATRRSWTSAALLRATAALFGWDWAEHEVLSGSVGEPHALEFGEWARVMDLGDPEEFLKNPQSVPYDAKREDRTFAIMSAVATCATLQQKKMDTYAERWNGGAECVAELLGRGCDKALLTVRGVGILERTIRLLQPLVAELFVVASDRPAYARFGLPVLPDLLPGRGALIGIHAALAQAAHPRVLCVACDMPLIARPLLDLLLAEAAGGCGARETPIGTTACTSPSTTISKR